MPINGYSRQFPSSLSRANSALSRSHAMFAPRWPCPTGFPGPSLNRGQCVLQTNGFKDVIANVVATSLILHPFLSLPTESGWTGGLSPHKVEVAGIPEKTHLNLYSRNSRWSDVANQRSVPAGYDARHRGPLLGTLINTSEILQSRNAGGSQYHQKAWPSGASIGWSAARRPRQTSVPWNTAMSSARSHHSSGVTVVRLATSPKSATKPVLTPRGQTTDVPGHFRRGGSVIAMGPLLD